MGKQRYINTKFWSDGWVVRLDVVERYLFLYFLTNEHTNIAGIYELPLEVMARETGLDKEQLTNIIPRFEGKVFYIGGWVYIRNFGKHQSTSEKIKKGVEASLKDIPTDIREKIKKLSNKEYPIDTLSIPYRYPSNYLNSNINTNSNKNTLAADAAEYSTNELGLKSLKQILSRWKNRNDETRPNNKYKWQDDGANAVIVLDAPADKIKSVFKCFRDNNQAANIALDDCVEKEKTSVLYFFKVYADILKKQKTI